MQGFPKYLFVLVCLNQPSFPVCGEELLNPKNLVTVFLILRIEIACFINETKCVYKHVAPYEF